MQKKFARLTCILGEHQFNIAQNFLATKRKIPHVADGGGDNEESAVLFFYHSSFHGICSKNPADWNMCRRSRVIPRRMSSGSPDSISSPAQTVSVAHAAMSLLSSAVEHTGSNCFDT